MSNKASKGSRRIKRTSKRPTATTGKRSRVGRPSPPRIELPRQLVLDPEVRVVADEVSIAENPLLHRLEVDRSRSPELAAGDLDAAWDAADVGDETVGGSAPTPDQDNVDGIGTAVGVTYEDLEPLHTTEKLEKRDRERWELHPASSEDFDERRRALGEPLPRTMGKRHTSRGRPAPSREPSRSPAAKKT